MRLDGRGLADSFKPQLEAALGPGSEVFTWLDETRDLLRLQRIRRRVLNVVTFILLALAAFGMANTLLMAAHERVREVGTLRALGMTEGGVLRLFLVEGALVGLFGSALGALWGGGLALYASRHPLDLSTIMETGIAAGGMTFSALVSTRFDPVVAAGAVAFGVVVAIVSSVFPARRASRLPPAEAVRAP